MKKQCTNCLEIKRLDKFGLNKKMNDGRASWCRDCSNQLSKDVSKTKVGVINTIYHSQVNNSKRRGHKLPTYSRIDLKDWCFSQKIFHELYDNWVKSNYQKDFKPSVDRKNDYLPYFFENIQLMTWKENKDKQSECFRNKTLDNSGFFNGGHKSVEAYDDEETFVIKFISISEAMRYFSLKSRAGIIRSCKNKQYKSANLNWRYTNEK